MSEIKTLIAGAEAVSLFCRLNINAKKNLPIRSSEMGLLIFVVKSEGSVTPVMASDFFKVTKPMVTTMVNALSKKGYLTKLQSPADKRSFTLYPTEKAVQLVEETYTEYFKNMSYLKSAMGQKKYDKMIALLELANYILLEDK